VCRALQHRFSLHRQPRSQFIFCAEGEDDATRDGGDRSLYAYFDGRELHSECGLFSGEVGGEAFHI
jgi:hypothetical protein